MTNYAGLDGLNWSSLKHIAVSPLEYIYRTEHPEPRKESYDMGAAFHCATLEPQKLNGRYVAYDGRRDKRTQAYKDFMAQHDGATILKVSEMLGARAMAAAMHRHHEAKRWLVGGRVEAPMQWTDPITGVKAKGRPDYLRPTGITDLKGTPDVAAHKVGKSAGQYLYHAQMAWYHNGAIACGYIPANAEPPVLAFCEWAPPHDVGFYQMSQGDLAAGEEAYRTLVERLLACIEMDVWPGKVSTTQPLELPGWALGMREER